MLVTVTQRRAIKIRIGATWGWTATTAGWATIARTRALVDALQVSDHYDDNGHDVYKIGITGQILDLGPYYE